MVLDKKVEVKLNNRITRYYIEKGYDLPTKIGAKGRTIIDTSKSITVNIEDLDSQSTVKVHTACDVCGEEKVMPYREYCRALDGDGLKTCQKCKTIKYKRTCLEKYGTTNTACLSETKEKVKKTNNERRGVNWAMESKEVQEKRRQTNLERYGCEWANQNKDVFQKVIDTNIAKYGVKSVLSLDVFQEKARNTMIEKYGTCNTMNIPEIRKKIESTNLQRYGSKSTFGCPEVYQKGINSKYKNGTTATSKQQVYLNDLYNGILNLSCSHYNLDIALDNIDIEYDGKGHDLSVTLGNISRHDFDVKQIVRDKIVKSKGYKIIRLISITDKFPSDEILLKILDISKNYFSTTSHTWFEWYFDENKYRNAEHMNGEFFDFGRLNKVAKR